MQFPDWKSLAFPQGSLLEPMMERDRLAVWLPGAREGGWQHWQRVANVAGAPVVQEHGIRATAATALQARQQLLGTFGRLVRRLREPRGGGTWLLPDGEYAQLVGDRQTGLLLAWSADQAVPLDEDRVRSTWPQAQAVQRLAPNLFLVAGVALRRTSPAPVPATVPPDVPRPAPPLPSGAPHEQAEHLLAAARQAGDRRAEADALTDLGAACLARGEVAPGTDLLHQALAISRELADRSLACDVLGNLGVAALAAGQPAQAVALLEQQLELARAVGERFAEKTALSCLGQAHGRLRDPDRAIDYFEQALALARELGDRLHEANLLWHVAIQEAERGRPDATVARGQAAIDLLRQTGNPQAAWFADVLEKFRRGEASGTAEPAATLPAGMAFGGSIVASAWSAPPPAHAQKPRGPGLLYQAFSATKSMAKFLGSGLQTVPADTQQLRLQTCATCEHHTGVRCKLCGCFTAAKAWLPHEDCPIRKWPR